MQQDGFALIPRSVLARTPEIGPVGLAVYAALASHANRDGLCWPSQGTLAEILGTSRRTVQAALKRLRDADLIAVQQRRRTTPLYRLQGAQPVATQGTQGAQPVAPLSPRGAENGTQGAQETTPKGRSQLRPNDNRNETTEQPGTGTGAGKEMAGRLNRTRAWRALTDQDFSRGPPDRSKLEACFAAAVEAGVSRGEHLDRIQFFATAHRLAREQTVRKPAGCFVAMVARGELTWAEAEDHAWANGQNGHNSRGDGRGGGPTPIGATLPHVQARGGIP